MNGQPDLLPLVRWTLAFLRPYRGRMALVAILLLFEVALGALQPWLLKVIIDYVFVGRPMPEPFAGWVGTLNLGDPIVLLVTLVAGGVVLQLTHYVLSAYSAQLQVDAGQRMVYGLRYRLLHHLQSLGLRHHVRSSVGDAVYRVDVDTYSIDNLLIGGFPLLTSVATLVVMFGVLLYLDVAVALLSLAVMPFLYLSLRYYMSRLMVREERVKELESKLVERLHETFSAIKLVKSFAREAYETARYATAGDRTMNERIGLTWQQSMFSLLVSGITVVGSALVLVVGGIRIIQQQMTIGDLTVVIAYLGAVYGPLSAIAHTAGQLQGALAGAKRIRDMLGQTPDVVDAPGAIEASNVSGIVRFEDVGFRYDDGARVLEGITFDVKPGEMVAIVGLTGAGKTTLVSLIPRLYDVSEGRVLVDGVDVRQYRIQSLRERVAIVLQEPMLFSGTIADNLRYGRLDATDAEIEAAARGAYAHDFIMRLPRGYQTEIAEAGSSLSGGERQRLSLARAILKDAPILILDEPTSSLDSISEEVVFDALKRLRAGRTTIVIAHRLSTVRDADCILVLDGGRIAAMGRHQELIGTSVLYRRMCARLSVGRSLDEPETVDELIEAARR
jgi:ATP-binding cassette subfamily B protein/subfamily B ATP-binding cassette protein MsbA